MNPRSRRIRVGIKALGDRLASNSQPVSGDNARGLSHRGGASTASKGLRGRATVALFAATGLVVAVVLLGMLGRDDAGRTGGDGSGPGLTNKEIVACSDGIGYGKVEAVKDVPGEDVRLTLEMTRWLKPAAGSPDTMTIRAASGRAKNEPPYALGDRVLVVLQAAVSNHQVYRDGVRKPPPIRERGAAMARILEEPPVACPSFWGS